MFWSVCIPVSAQVSTGSTTNWHRGKDLQKSSRLPLSVTWSDTPIRQQLDALSQQQRRSMFLDRRVDPTQLISLTVRDSTTEQVAWKAADEAGLGVARVGDLLYFGPKDSATRLPFVIEALKKQIPKQQRSKWEGRSELRWRTATNTTEFATWFEQVHGIKFDGDIPYDVWPQGDWPSLSLLEQVSLLLVGFDRSFQISDDGASVKLIPLPQLKSAKIKIRIARDAKLNIDEAKATFTDLKIAGSGKTVAVTGPVESLAAFKAWQVNNQTVLRGEKVIRTFDLDTTAKRGDILATVAAQTGRELVLQGRASQSLVNRITLKVQKVSLEDLIAKCLEGTDLTWQLSDSKLTISEN